MTMALQSTVLASRKDRVVVVIIAAQAIAAQAIAVQA
jgi:hypothetical protein